MRAYPPDAKLNRLIHSCPMLRLKASETDDLLAQPETGMGYQVVEAILEDDSKEQGVAYNAELLFLGNETQSHLRSSSYTTVLKAAKSSGIKIKKLRVLTRETAAHRSDGIWATSRVLKEKAPPAKDAPIERTKADEVFKRFSAFANDRRRKPNGGWRDGTYATTEEDAKKIKTGKDAVARYALPNPAPASYVFTGCPHNNTEIQKGTVAPAYDQPGGGVEVIFTEGTQANTVTGPDKIPDE